MAKAIFDEHKSLFEDPVLFAKPDITAFDCMLLIKKFHKQPEHRLWTFILIDIDVTSRGGRKTRTPVKTIVSRVNGMCRNNHSHPNGKTCRVLLCSAVPSLPHHIPEWVTIELGKVFNVKWPNAVSRATVVAMDTCVLSVNNTYLMEQNKGRAKFVDYRWLFMRPGLKFFEPYIAPGLVNNIVSEQWMWTVLKTDVLEKVMSYILAAYKSFEVSY
jgi:hypothetical protein